MSGGGSPLPDESGRGSGLDLAGDECLTGRVCGRCGFEAEETLRTVLLMDEGGVASRLVCGHCAEALFELFLETPAERGRHDPPSDAEAIERLASAFEAFKTSASQ